MSEDMIDRVIYDETVDALRISILHARELADRIAALEAEASEGERRGLERAAGIARSFAKEPARKLLAKNMNGRWPVTAKPLALQALSVEKAIRALISEAPIQRELGSDGANQISTPEFGLPEAPAREGELEAAAKAIFEQKGLHLSTGKAWERATRADRYYCLQYAEAVLIAIGRLPPPPSQDREG